MCRRGMSTLDVDITMYSLYDLYVQCSAIYYRKSLSKADIENIIKYIKQLVIGLRIMLTNLFDQFVLK